MKHKKSVNKAIPDFFKSLVPFVNNPAAFRHASVESRLSSYVKFIVLLILLPLGLDSFAQSYTMSAFNGQTVTTCSGTFYDSGGAGSDYGNSEDLTVSFCSGNGNAVKFDFLSFVVRAGDTLYVYDGPDTSSPLMGKYSNAAVPPSLISSATCMTFRFVSDILFTRPGWIAAITCCPPPVTSSIVPADPYQCAGSTVNYSVAMHPGSTYNWTVINGTPASVTGGTNNLDITWDPAGDVTGFIRVVEVNSCGSKDSSQLFVDIYSLPVVDYSGLNPFYCSYSPPAVLTGSPAGGIFTGPGISGNTFTPSVAGQGIHTITYTYTDPGTGCTNQKSSQTEVTVPQVFVVGASANSYCAGFGVDITLSGSEAGVSYQLLKGGANDGAPLPGTGSPLLWNNRQNGIYTIVATYNLTACTNNMSGSQTIVQNPLPVPSFTSQPGAATCSSTVVTYTTQAGQSGYIWGYTGVAGTDYNIISGGSGTDNTVSLVWLTAGSKTVTVNYTDLNGCTAIAPTASNVTTVTLSPPAPTGTAIQNFCSEVSPTVASLAATGTAIKWYAAAVGGAPLPAATPLVNNAHYYASQTVGGCESLTRFDVTARIFSIPPAPVAGAGTGATCSRITAHWAAAAGATSYRLDVSTVNTFATFVAGFQDRNVGNVLLFNVTGLTAGVTYYYRVRAADLCGTSPNSGTISYATLPAAPSTPGAIAGITPQCPALPGQSYSVAAVLNATTYTWTVPAGWSITAGQGTRFATVTTGAAGQNGNITVTAGNTCGTSAPSILAVTVLPNAGVASVTGASPLCIGGSAAYTANGVVLSGGTGSWTSSNPAVASVSAAGLVTGVSAGACNIIFTITGGCGGDISAQQPVTISPNASITSVTGASPLCIGGTTTFTANGVVLSGGSGSWSSSNPAVATVSAAGLVTGITAGTCNIIYTIAGGCGGNVSAQQPVTISPNAAVASVTGSSPLCTGGTAAYTANGVVLSGGTGSWSSSNAAVATVSPAGLVTGISAGTCNIVYTITGGCGGDVSAQQPVTVNTDASVTSVTGASPLCMGGTASYTANGVILSGGTGTWSSSNPAIATVSAAGLVTGVSAGTCNIIYTITGGCGGNVSALQPVTINPNSAIASVTGATPLCIGGTAAFTANGVVTGGGTGSWSSSNPAVATVSAAGLVTGISAGSCNIIYTVTGGCGGNVSAQQPVTISPNASITSVTGASPLCIGGTAPYAANGAILSGGTGTWSSSNPAVAAVSAAGLVTGISAGTCNIIYTIAGGCGGNVSAQQPVTINPDAGITSVTGASPLCIGGTATYTANGVVLSGGTGAWSSSNPAVATVSAAGLVTGISAGACNIIYTITGGCGGNTAAQQPVTVNPNAKVTSILGNTLFCIGGTSLLMPNGVVPGGGTGAWSSSNPAIATVSAAGLVTGVSAGSCNIIYTITGGCGGTVSAQQPVTVNPNAAVASVTGASPLCIGGTANYTANGVVLSGGAGAWSSSNPAIATVSPGGLVTGVSPGLCSIVYTISGGCGGNVSALKPVTVNPPAAVASVTGAPTLCIGATAAYTANGVVLSGGTGAWSSSNPAVATVSAAGLVRGISAGSCNIIYTVTGGCGGNVSAQQPVTVNPNASIASVTGAGPLCISGTAVFTANGVVLSGGTGAWSSSNPAIASVNAAGLVTGISAGTCNIIFTITGGCGGIVTRQQPVTINPDAAVASVTGASPVCTGNSVNYTANGVVLSGGTGAWSSSNPAVAAVNAAGLVTGIAPGSCNIIYTITGGCSGIVSASSGITVAAPPAVTGIKTDPACSGGTTGGVDITVTGGTAPITFVWTGNGIVQGIEDQADLGAGLYTVSVSDAAGCSIPALGFTLVEPPALTGSVTSLTNVSAFGGNDGSVTVAGAGGTPAYQYSINGGSFQASGTFGSLTAGSYTVTVRDNNLCTTDVPAIITQPGPPLAGMVVSQTDAVCFGGSSGSVTVQGSDGVPPYEYSLDAGTYQPSGTFGSLAAGNHTVTVRDAVLATIDINFVTGQPAPFTGSTTVTDVLCFGDATGSVDLTVAGGAAPFTYLWSNGAVTEDLADLTAGNYDVLITDANNCTANSSGTVSGPAAALSASATVTGYPCPAVSNGAIDLTVTGGTAPYTFLWSNGDTGEDLINVPAGNYTVAITDAAGCTTASGAVLNEVSGIITVADARCSGGSDGSADLAVTGGMAPYTFLWSNGATTEDISGLAAGDYSVTITDGGGCTATVSATIGEPAVLSGMITVADVVCKGSASGSADLTVTGGTPPYAFLWDNGMTTEDLAAVAAGDYTVIVTDLNGCTFSGMATIVEPAEILTGSVDSKTDLLCAGSSSGSVTVSAAGGVGPYEFSLNGGAFQSSGLFAGLSGGAQTVTLRDAIQCTIDIPVTIAEPQALGIEFTKTDASCPDVADGSITLTITGGSAPYAILWSDGETAASRPGITSGTYSVAVTDNNGCAASRDIELGYMATGGCLEIQTIITPNGDGFNDTWKIRNIDLFPNAEVFVFNRWGELVFHTRNLSANPWDGTSGGKLLPTDSYHYILHLNDGSKPRSGVISIIR